MFIPAPAKSKATTSIATLGCNPITKKETDAATRPICMAAAKGSNRRSLPITKVDALTEMPKAAIAQPAMNGETLSGSQSARIGITAK